MATCRKFLSSQLPAIIRSNSLCTPTTAPTVHVFDIESPITINGPIQQHQIIPCLKLVINNINGTLPEWTNDIKYGINNSIMCPIREDIKNITVNILNILSGNNSPELLSYSLKEEQRISIEPLRSIIRSVNGYRVANFKFSKLVCAMAAHQMIQSHSEEWGMHGNYVS